MVVSQNQGTPIWTPKYYSPYYWDPQNGTLNFGKPPYNPRYITPFKEFRRELAWNTIHYTGWGGSGSEGGKNGVLPKIKGTFKGL